MMRSYLICPLFLAIAIAGCGVGAGPGSASDALRFANARIAELNEPVIQQDAGGKWYRTRKEIRNVRPGYVSGTFKKLRAKVTYEYRDQKTDLYDTKEEAESAEPKPAGEEWREAEELYVFKNGACKLDVVFAQSFSVAQAR